MYASPDLNLLAMNHHWFGGWVHTVDPIREDIVLYHSYESRAHKYVTDHMITVPVNDRRRYICNVVFHQPSEMPFQCDGTIITSRIQQCFLILRMANVMLTINKILIRFSYYSA